MTPTRVAFQGARGAFSEQACSQILAHADLHFEPCERFFDTFSALRDGLVDYAVVPIENTLHGSVHENYDHLVQFEAPILAETQVRIVHNLIGRPEATTEGIGCAISHPVALAQCLEFFRRHPGIRVESHYDTGGSVKTVMESGDASLAAVASSAAAEYYGATILEASIEDDPENYTRFFLLGENGAAVPDGVGPTKTSLVFVTKNEAGALYNCMSAFALRNINMTKIESRPLKGRPFEYRFYVDIQGEPGDDDCAAAIRSLQQITESLAVLGSYRSVAKPASRVEP